MGVKTGDGLKDYYKTKIEALELNVRDKSNNLRRLEAQRNELNSRVRLLKEEVQSFIGLDGQEDEEPYFYEGWLRSAYVHKIVRYRRKRRKRKAKRCRRPGARSPPCQRTPWCLLRGAGAGASQRCYAKTIHSCKHDHVGQL